MGEQVDLASWEQRCATFLRASAEGDPAHDDEHTRRVVASARTLAAAEGADLAVVVPAAWLHDCVSIPKDSPRRPLASRLAAEAATAFLTAAGYPTELVPAVAHAIAAHSFTAGITPTTIEARVVQDADRLDALGAIGIARCLMLGATMGRPLYDPREPAQRRATMRRWIRPLIDEVRYALRTFERYSPASKFAAGPVGDR